MSLDGIIQRLHQADLKKKKKRPIFNNYYSLQHSWRGGRDDLSQDGKPHGDALGLLTTQLGLEGSGWLGGPCAALCCPFGRAHTIHPKVRVLPQPQPNTPDPETEPLGSWAVVWHSPSSDFLSTGETRLVTPIPHPRPHESMMRL